MKTLLLNPPSFENFDGGASSRWPATREIRSFWYPVWLTYPAGMIPDSKVVDAPPHDITVEQTVQMAPDYDFLVLFTSTPGFQSDIRLAAAMKDQNPNLHVAFVGPHVTVLPEESLNASHGHRFRLSQGVRPHGYGVCRREAAAGDRRRQLSQQRGHRSQPGPGAGSGFGRAAARRGYLQARPGYHALQRAVPAAPVSVLLHRAGLPGAVHLLPVAPDAERPSVAHAQRERCGRGDAQGAGVLSGPEGDLLRRRYVQHPQIPCGGTLQQAEAAELHLVLHLARNDGLRDAEDHEGGRLPAAHRGI